MEWTRHISNMFVVDFSPIQLSFCPPFDPPISEVQKCEDRRQFQSLPNWMWQRLEIFTRRAWILCLWSFWCPNIEFRPFFWEFPAFVTFNLAFFETTSWTPVFTFLNANNWRIKKWVGILLVTATPNTFIYFYVCIHN